MKHLIIKNKRQIILILLLIIFWATEFKFFLPPISYYALEESLSINALPQDKSFYSLQKTLTHLDNLEKYIGSYYPDKTQEEKNLILMRLIRYLRPHYNNVYWTMLAGEVDYGIESAINYNPNIKRSLLFFEDLSAGESIVDPNSQNKIDFKHLISTLNVIMSFNNYNTYCDLAGWAGDLHSCIGDLQSRYYNPTLIKNSDYERYALMIIGNSKYHFPLEDILADIDAYNISNKMKTKPNKSLSKVLLDYYLHDSNKRFLTFINTYSFTDENSEKVSLFQERVEEVTSLEYVKTWPANDVLKKYKKHDYTQAELTALGNAFLSYMREQVMKELEKPLNTKVLSISFDAVEVSWESNGNPAETHYKIAIFDEKNILVEQSEWTSGLKVKFENLAPFTPYIVKGKVKVKGLDNIETDWHPLNRFFPAGSNHIFPLFRIFYNKAIEFERSSK